MTNYEKLMQIMPNKDALRWLNKEFDKSSLDDIAYLLSLPDVEEE